MEQKNMSFNKELVATLLDCPFCGCAPKVERSYYQANWFDIKCSHCPSKMSFKLHDPIESLERAIYFWNHRKEKRKCIKKQLVVVVTQR